MEDLKDWRVQTESGKLGEKNYNLKEKKAYINDI